MMRDEGISDWPDMEVIDLSKEDLHGPNIELLRVDLPGGWDKPFALVHYAEAGEEQTYGLRLDRDKGAFLDHLDNPESDRFVQSQANRILDFLTEHQRSVVHTNPLEQPRIIALDSSGKDRSRYFVGDGIKLSRIELLGESQSRFGVIWYVDEYGKQPKYGIRIDLEKEALLDRIGDEKKDGFLRQTIPQIMSVVRQAFH